MLEDEDLSDLAIQLARAGKFDEALQILGKTEDAGWRSKVLREIAEAIARTGKFEDAIEVANEIEVA